MIGIGMKMRRMWVCLLVGFAVGGAALAQRLWDCGIGSGTLTFS